MQEWVEAPGPRRAQVQKLPMIRVEPLEGNGLKAFHLRKRAREEFLLLERGYKTKLLLTVARVIALSKLQA